MITIPDTTKGNHLVFVRGIWYAIYSVNGKLKRKSMKTAHFKEAVVERDKFFASLVEDGSAVKLARTPQEKVRMDDRKYVYRRPPFTVKVGKHFVGYAENRKSAVTLRDAYLATLK